MARWYTQEDYYFTHSDKYEFNIKATSPNTITVSIFDHNRNPGDTLVEEANAGSIEEAAQKIYSYTNEKINLPTINNLLQLQK